MNVGEKERPLWVGGRAVIHRHVFRRDAHSACLCVCVLTSGRVMTKNVVEGREASSKEPCYQEDSKEF